VPPRRKERVVDRSKLDATPPWETRSRETGPATTGPFDVRDAPADGVSRVNLGALSVPVHRGLELRLEVNAMQQVVAATIVGPHGHMQLGVFAAPRSDGIWDEVRAEIEASLGVQRGQRAEPPTGPWGPEVVGTISGDRGKVPVRFVGIDGPRWFLRAMFVGAVANDRGRAAALEQVLRNVIVDRGSAPLPVREAVPLEMPRNAELPSDAVEEI
jgi:hypothetical protein